MPSIDEAGKLADQATKNPVKFIITGLILIVMIMGGVIIKLSHDLSDCQDSKEAIIQGNSDFILKQNGALQSKIDEMLNEKLRELNGPVQQKQNVVIEKADNVSQKVDSISNVINKIAK